MKNLQKFLPIQSKALTLQSLTRTRGVAQLVSAPRSGRGGRKFESSHPDKENQPCGWFSFCLCPRRRVVGGRFRAARLPQPPRLLRSAAPRRGASLRRTAARQRGTVARLPQASRLLHRAQGGRGWRGIFFVVVITFLGKCAIFAKFFVTLQKHQKNLNQWK